MTLPVTVLTGWLGAGKTSLINHLLAPAQGQRIAAVVNDFGTINIDAELISNRSDTVIGLSNGCICCSLQGDLLRVLRTLVEMQPHPDHVVIEASGLADPHGIIQALSDPILWPRVRLSAVVALVNAEDSILTPGRIADPLWRAQVAAADLLLLNRAAGQDAGGLHAALAATGRARLVEQQEAGQFAGLILDPITDGAQRVAVANRPVLTAAGYAALSLELPGACVLPRFAEVIETLSPDLLRGKGILEIAGTAGQGMVFQLVGSRATLAPHDVPVRGSRLTLIGRRTGFDPDLARKLVEGAMDRGTDRDQPAHR